MSVSISWFDETVLTSLGICAEIDCIFLDVEARPFWRPMKPDWASVARVFVAVTLVLFADDSCLRAAIVMISTEPFGTVRVPTITAGYIKGVGLLLQILVVGGRGPSNIVLNFRQSGVESRL
jgi:hypothetical protein